MMKLLISLVSLLSTAHAAPAAKWKSINTYGNFLPRDNFGAGKVDGEHCGYVFGGALNDFGDVEYFNDLHKFEVDDDTAVFTEIVAEGPPTKRQFPGLAATEFFVAVGGGGIVEIEGNQTTLIPAEDVFMLYDREEETWTNYSMDGPSPRFGPSVVASEEYFYEFGGITNFLETLSDLWRFDTNTKTWERLSNEEVDPRHVARGVAGDGKLYFYGGETFSFESFFGQLSSISIYDINGRNWTVIDPPGAPNQVYGAFDACEEGDQLILYGGDISGGVTGCGATFKQNPVDKVWSFSLNDNSWTELNIKKGLEVKRLQGMCLDGFFYAIGGFEFECPGGEGEGQIFVEHVRRFEVEDDDSDDSEDSEDTEDSED